MVYRKLSELVTELNNPQQSEIFVKLFKAAVREGKIDAMDLAERFTMPKVYNRRGAEGTYQRDTRDMLYDNDAKAEAWVQATLETLSKAKTSARMPKVKIGKEAVESGAIDFQAAVEETRRKMQAKYEKGHQLGISRSRKKK